MDIKRKKELILEWKNRHPEMGVVSVRCIETGNVFLGVTNDTSTWFNRHRFQLNAKNHRNKPLQELWKKYGESGFECSVLKILKYDDPAEDQTEKLNELLDECLEQDPQAKQL